MLMMRKTQMTTFEQASIADFEKQMLEHLAEFSPPLFKTVGEEQAVIVAGFLATAEFAHGLAPLTFMLKLTLSVACNPTVLTPECRCPSSAGRVAT